MTHDPYENVRAAFHAAADGLMDWQDPPERAERRSEGTGAVYLARDIPALEEAAESLTRLGDLRNAIALWALALRVRQGVGDATS